MHFSSRLHTFKVPSLFILYPNACLTVPRTSYTWNTLCWTELPSADFYQAKYCRPDPVLGARDTKIKRKQGSGLGTNTAVELGTWETRRHPGWGTPGEGALERRSGLGRPHGWCRAWGSLGTREKLPQEGWAISVREEQKLKPGGVKGPGLARVLGE